LVIALEAALNSFSRPATFTDNIHLGWQCQSELNDLILCPQAFVVCDGEHVNFFHEKKICFVTYSASSGAHSTTRNTQFARMVRITNDSKYLQSELRYRNQNPLNDFSHSRKVATEYIYNNSI